ncbi:CvpA family protein [Streptococcus fryi]
MISLLLLFIFAWHFYIGYSRGIVLQAYYTTSAVVAFMFSIFYYKRLADALTLWVPYASPTEESTVFFFKTVNIFELDRVFYSGVAFTIIYVAVFLLLRFLGLFIHFVDHHRFDTSHYQIISGGLSVLLSIFFTTMLLTILATIPISMIQNLLEHNLIFRFLIKLPILSQLLQYLWVTAIL